MLSWIRYWNIATYGGRVAMIKHLLKMLFVVAIVVSLIATIPAIKNWWAAFNNFCLDNPPPSWLK